MRGAVALIDKFGNILRNYKYSSKPERHDIFSQWEKEYGDKINSCSIVISPEVNEEAVSVSGMNCRKDFPARLDFDEQAE